MKFHIGEVVSFTESFQNEIEEYLFPFLDSLQETFTDLDFGDGVQHIFIGYAIFEDFHKPYFKPKRTRFSKISKSKGFDLTIEGSAVDKEIVITRENVLEIECWIPHDSFLRYSTVEQRAGLLLSVVYQHLKAILDKRKFKNFDKDKFLSNLKVSFEEFLKEKGIDFLEINSSDITLWQ